MNEPPDITGEVEDYLTRTATDEVAMFTAVDPEKSESTELLGLEWGRRFPL